MGTAERLESFLRFASGNTDLRQSHLSLYSAILMYHQNRGGQNPFRVSRRELMGHSAIRSFATYHKCMNGLIASGLVAYRPSYHPSLASQITLLDPIVDNGENCPAKKG
jgi:hypothetical protein